MRRPYCKGLHNWQPDGTGHGCTKCPATAPCAVECGHPDCDEDRGRLSTCNKCKQPVALEDQFRLQSGLILHKGCRSVA